MRLFWHARLSFPRCHVQKSLFKRQSNQQSFDSEPRLSRGSVKVDWVLWALLSFTGWSVSSPMTVERRSLAILDLGQSRLRPISSGEGEIGGAFRATRSSR